MKMTISDIKALKQQYIEIDLYVKALIKIQVPKNGNAEALQIQAIEDAIRIKSQLFTQIKAIEDHFKSELIS